MLSKLIYQPFEGSTTAKRKHVKENWTENLVSVYTGKEWLSSRKIGNKEEWIALVEAQVFNGRMKIIADELQALSSKMDKLKHEYENKLCMKQEKIYSDMAELAAREARKLTCAVDKLKQNMMMTMPIKGSCSYSWRRSSRSKRVMMTSSRLFLLRWIS
eukprot:TRINITY_DN24490_c0_g1_i1.p1 TRINITY_DN24490_c0_g1~~TRINITY_DN24490_c0_g1_i1.p1  ORF type:complete len:176 (-),score=30.08 TRINITY_DN24490_c0_g1_i1:330-806(-)